MAIDWTKPVQTRNGRKVRVLCTDGPDTLYPVIGLIEGGDGTELWKLSGMYASNGATCNLDIINTPEPAVTVTRWVNVYPDRITSHFETKEKCDWVADGNRIACVPVTITYRPGEGLD